MQQGTSEEALARQCVRGSEGQGTDLEAVAVLRQEILWPFTLYLRAMRNFFLAGDGIHLPWPLRERHLSWPLIKPAAAALAAWRSQVPLGAAPGPRAVGPAQLCSIFSMTLWTVKEKDRKWYSLNSYCVPGTVLAIPCAFSSLSHHHGPLIYGQTEAQEGSVRTRSPTTRKWWIWGSNSRYLTPGLHDSMLHSLRMHFSKGKWLRWEKNVLEGIMRHH